jgi:hypothetical protein
VSGLAEVLAAHQICWRTAYRAVCSCGRWARPDPAAGSLNAAARIEHEAHVADQITAHLADRLAAPEVVAAVARAILDCDIAAGRAHEWDDGDEIHEWFREDATAALGAVRELLGGGR